jgi:hypothetical protein
VGSTSGPARVVTTVDGSTTRNAVMAFYGGRMASVLRDSSYMIRCTATVYFYRPTVVVSKEIGSAVVVRGFLLRPHQAAR